VAADWGAWDGARSEPAELDEEDVVEDVEVAVRCWTCLVVARRACLRLEPAPLADFAVAALAPIVFPGSA
jgi:hypothetical protein